MSRKVARIPGSRAFGALVQKRRGERSMSRHDLASLTGLKYDNIKVIETRMIKTFRLDHVEAICRVLDIHEIPQDEPIAMDLWWVEDPNKKGRPLTVSDRRLFRRLRQKRNMTQHEVASQVGLSNSAYQFLEYERQMSDPSTDTLGKVATVLRVGQRGTGARMMRALGLKFVGPVEHQHRTRKEINWDEVPLGKMSDGDLARELKTDLRNVFQERKQRNIPAFRGPKRPPKQTCSYTAKQLQEALGDAPLVEGRVDWTKVPLGCTRDAEVAQWLRVSAQTVKFARHRRKIANWSPVCWDKAPFGKVPDKVIAEWVGVSTAAVAIQRRKANIPAAPKSARRGRGVEYLKPPQGLVPPRRLEFPSW